MDKAIELVALLVFIAAAMYCFATGSSTNGILWLVLAQLYDNRPKR